MNDPSEAKASLNQILNTKEMNDACSLLGNLLGDAVDAIEDKTAINFPALTEELFDKNTTSIVAALVKLEKYHTKEDITKVLQYYSEQMCSIGLMFAKASYLDY